MTKTFEVELTKRGNDLVGIFEAKPKPTSVPKPVMPDEYDETLRAKAESMADGDTVKALLTIDYAANGKRTFALHGVARLHPVPTDNGSRAQLVKQNGGFVNPYTFVPTLPREDLAATGLDDGSPPSHGRHGTGQWSGVLVVRLTTLTPLLLPVVSRDGDPRTFEIRLGPDGRPHIHGASLKGAIRSPFETITASRYGVFFEHDDPLAYRAPVSAALSLIPARVHTDADGHRFFRLCRGDDAWRAPGRDANQVQDAAWVPAYQKEPVRQLGALEGCTLTDLNRCQVYARVVLCTYRKVNKKGEAAAQFQIWRATHLALTAQEINNAVDAGDLGPRFQGHVTRIDGVQPRIVAGWLAATGRSISTKHDERLFVESPGQDIPLTERHVDYWRSVLLAYDRARDYNDPQATYQARRDITRSQHVPSTAKLRELPDGTLVYVRCDPTMTQVSQVHPVMIGRLPFASAPADLLPPSLRPAQRRAQLSPADRLFGWVPPGRGDDGAQTNEGSSGYRGRLRIERVTCLTDDWKPEAPFPGGSITLAPLSSPKPTQFRFYASPDATTGYPMEVGAAKDDGYHVPGGLRGRKMYRWRKEAEDYWQPTKQDDTTRGYLALEAQRQHATQVSAHRDWVRPGVTFEAVLRLDGVPEPELGALLWLLSRGDTAPLRLGAGKPYGFGVMSVSVDHGTTRLWDANGVRAGWLRLDRPAPVEAAALTELASQFEVTAQGHPVLREAVESYLAATAPVAGAVHYPRLTEVPAAESYQWFVENERIDDRKIKYGLALPHVRDSQPCLPYLPKESNDEGQQGGKRRGRQ